MTAIDPVRTTVTPGDIVTVRIPSSSLTRSHGLDGKVRQIRVCADDAVEVLCDDGTERLLSRALTWKECGIYSYTQPGRDRELWAYTLDLPPRASRPVMPSNEPRPQCCGEWMRKHDDIRTWTCRTEPWHTRLFHTDGADDAALTYITRHLCGGNTASGACWYALDRADTISHEFRLLGELRRIQLWLLTPEAAQEQLPQGCQGHPHLDPGGVASDGAPRDAIEHIVDYLNIGNALGIARWYATEDPVSHILREDGIWRRLGLYLRTDTAMKRWPLRDAY